MPDRPDGGLAAEQRAVLELIESTRDHVFVTGRAGTGKSTLLQAFLAATDRTVIVCAPTGVAALNVGGQTIHSLFRLPIGLIADQELEALRQEERTGQDPADLKDLFRKGEKVMVTQGIFGGMGGIVERVDGVFTLVRFGSRMRVKISTFILEPNSVITRTQAVKAA